jgi:hypothetical protein
LPDDWEEVARILSLIDKGWRLEERGRHVAFHSDAIVGFEDLNWLSDLADMLRDLSELFEDGGLRGWADLVRDLASVARSLREDARECSEYGLRRRECRVSHRTESSLREADRKHKRLTGQSCAWLIGAETPYMYSSAANDLTACFHRLLESAEKWLVPTSVTEDKCTWRTRTANPRLVELCRRIWNPLTAYFLQLGLFTSDTYGLIESYVSSTEVTFKLGGVHAMHYDIERDLLSGMAVGTGAEDINRAVVRLVEERIPGARCSIERGWVYCEGLRGNLEELYKIMSFLPEIWGRLYEPERYYGRRFEKLDGACRDIADPVEREVCAYKVLVERARRELGI